MDSNEAKNFLLNYFLYQRCMPLATTEYNLNGYLADIFILDHKYRGIEIEIKVSKLDLITELNSIKALLNEDKPKKSAGKYAKHREYLNITGDNERLDLFQSMHNNELPNKFSFAVTNDLEEVALDGIKGTPYGLIVLDDGDSWSYRPKVIVQAKLLHDKEFKEDRLLKYLRKLSLENYTLRSKLYK